jgi:hypothetical protein
MEGCEKGVDGIRPVKVQSAMKSEPVAILLICLSPALPSLSGHKVYLAEITEKKDDTKHKHRPSVGGSKIASPGRGSMQYSDIFKSFTEEVQAQGILELDQDYSNNDIAEIDPGALHDNALPWPGCLKQNVWFGKNYYLKRKAVKSRRACHSTCESAVV